MKDKKAKLRIRAPGSLASGINIAYMITFAAFLFLICGSVFLSFRFFILGSADEEILRIEKQVIENKDKLLTKDVVKSLIEQVSMGISIYNKNGDEIINEKSSGVIGKPPYIEKENKIISYDDYNHHYRSKKIKVSINNNDYFVQISRDMGRENISFNILSNILLYAFIIALAVSAFVGFKVAERYLKPINTMSTTIKSITVNDLSKRIETKNTKSELKELANSINSSLDKIQAAYENQSVFVSDVSHELRTPLAAIQGYSDLLSRWGKQEPEVLEESISAINFQAKAMRELVDKLLFLTRAQAKGLTLNPIHFNLYDFLKDIISQHNFLLSSHKVILNVSKTSVIYADIAFIRQLFVILLENAVKYTPSNGTIEIAIKENQVGVTLMVIDSGVGIQSEHLERIFDRFYRIDKSRAKGTGGFGLGLAIAKQIVEVHKGKITANSIIGKGTKIEIFLPKE